MLENLFTGVLGVLLAGAGDGRPNLFVALALPPVLAVLLVLGTALSLSVGIVLGPVLIHADLVIYRVTLALLNGGALLPRHVDAILLDEVLALLLVDRLAYLRFGHRVLGVPDGGVLHPIGDRGGGTYQRLLSSGTASASSNFNSSVALRNAECQPRERNTEKAQFHYFAYGKLFASPKSTFDINQIVILIGSVCGCDCLRTDIDGLNGQSLYTLLVPKARLFKYRVFQPGKTKASFL